MRVCLGLKCSAALGECLSETSDLYFVSFIFNLVDFDG